MTARSTGADHQANEAQASLVCPGNTSDTGQGRIEDQRFLAGVGASSSVDQRSAVTHGMSVDGGHNSGPGHSPAVTQSSAAWSEAQPLLTLLADMLDDLERTRIANENRLRQLTRDQDDSDGINRGFGLTLDHPLVAQVAALVTELGAMEHQATLMLQRAVRKHPLGPWVKRTVGVGEKQGARLLATVGDPYWNTLYDRPRLVSELWAYCGYHVLPAGSDNQGVFDTQPYVGIAASRSKGQKANWSATAKMRAFLVAESCIKHARSPYREVYDKGRAKYLLAQHATACRRCGPKGKPALPGSELSDGHKHARALRLVAKEVLKDLWLESKALHEAAT